MDDAKIRLMIKSQLGNLTKIETMIAEYILAFPNCILETNITELAFKMDVSRNAMTRFCKRFGFEGYTDFKYEYTRQLHGIEKHDSMTADIIDTLASKLYELTTPELEQAYRLVAQKMFQHNSIKVIATGQSSVAATHLRYKMQLFNKYVDIMEPFIYGGDLTYAFDETDYVLVFTVGSRSHRTNQLIKGAMAKTKLVDIFTMNQLAEYDLATIILPNVENKLPYKLHNQIIFLTVIDIITNFYALSFGQPIRKDLDD